MTRGTNERQPMTNPVIPEAAVVAVANELHDREGYLTSLADSPDYRKARYMDMARELLEAACPHILPVHSYAAAGFTICGVQTGGAISRHDGYQGPTHQTTADESLVTCEDCKRKLAP